MSINGAFWRICPGLKYDISLKRPVERGPKWYLHLISSCRRPIFTFQPSIYFFSIWFFHEMLFLKEKN